MKTQRERDKRRREKENEKTRGIFAAPKKQKKKPDVSVSIQTAQEQEQEEKERLTRRAFHAPQTAAAKKAKKIRAIDYEITRTKKARAMLRAQRGQERGDIIAVLERVKLLLGESENRQSEQTDEIERCLKTEFFAEYAAAAVARYIDFSATDNADGTTSVNNAGAGRNSRAYVIPTAEYVRAQNGITTAHDLRELMDTMAADHRNDWPTHDFLSWLGFSRVAIREYARLYGQVVIFRNDGLNFLRYGIPTYYALRPRPVPTAAKHADQKEQAQADAARDEYYARWDFSDGKKKAAQNTGTKIAHPAPESWPYVMSESLDTPYRLFQFALRAGAGTGGKKTPRKKKGTDTYSDLGL